MGSPNTNLLYIDLLNKIIKKLKTNKKTRYEFVFDHCASEKSSR